MVYIPSAKTLGGGNGLPTQETPQQLSTVNGKALAMVQTQGLADPGSPKVQQERTRSSTALTIESEQIKSGLLS